MINSSKTEYAFWKLKMLEGGEDEWKEGSIQFSLVLTGLVRIPARGVEFIG